MKSEKLRFPIAIAGAVVAVGTAGIMAQRCSRRPLEEPCAASPPVRDDGQCEIEKGERDPSSPTFDLGSCGYCGDGIRQRWETPDNCAIDFHCGNGRVDRNVFYASWTEDRGTLVLSVRNISESCEPESETYCAPDCRLPPCRESGGCLPDGGTQDSGYSGMCPPELLHRLIGRVSGELMSRAGTVRSAAGAPPDASVRAAVRIEVNENIPRVGGVTLYCDGCRGGTLPSTTINLTGIVIGDYGNCSSTMSVMIPPL